MKTKVANLSGPALEWIVEGIELDKQVAEGKHVKQWIIDRHKTDKVASTMYTNAWAWGGPLIEREDISFRKYHNPKSEAHGTYYAKVCRDSGSMIRWSKEYDQSGLTPLIAAMRCYVVSQLGAEVEVPEELS